MSDATTGTNTPPASTTYKPVGDDRVEELQALEPAMRMALVLLWLHEDGVLTDDDYSRLLAAASEDDGGEAIDDEAIDDEEA